MAFRMLPEYILEDIADYQLFLMSCVAVLLLALPIVPR